MTYSFNPADIKHVIPFRFHGRTFKAFCADGLFHPSTWTHLDETEVRDDWWHVQPGHVVLDVGADFGSYTLTALACGAAHVYAWSPPFKLPEQPAEAETLVRSVNLNGWGARCTVYSSGLYDRVGWLAAFDGPRNAQYHATRDEALLAIDGQDGHCAVFPVVPLDTMGIDRCDWLKVDTENCELAILRGAEQTIRKCRPRIILENHTHLDPDCEAKHTAFLAELGYTHQLTRPHHTISHSLYLP